MIEYTFEGRTISTTIDAEVLDRLAGLVIAYKMLSKSKVVKAAREQEGFIKGFLYGLEVANIIDSDDSEELLAFFMS